MNTRLSHIEKMRKEGYTEEQIRAIEIEIDELKNKILSDILKKQKALGLGNKGVH